MPGSPTDAFYQLTDNVFALRTFERVTPLITRFVSVLKTSRTSAETLQGNLSPSAALNRKSAREYLLIFQPRIEVLAMPDRYARNAPLHAR